MGSQVHDRIARDGGVASIVQEYDSLISRGFVPEVARSVVWGNFGIHRWMGDKLSRRGVDICESGYDGPVHCWRGVLLPLDEGANASGANVRDSGVGISSGQSVAEGAGVEGAGASGVAESVSGHGGGGAGLDGGAVPVVPLGRDGDACEPVAEPVRGKNYSRNRGKRERRKVERRAAAVRGVDGSGGCVSDASVCTVDTRTALEIEAAQTLAERRIAENRLAVAQANARTASYADKDKSKALERLHAVRLSQRINQATAAANKAYDARDKSLTSVDSAGSAGEYALRQEIKAARNSQFLNEYLRKQNDILARYADSAALAAADRVPKPRFDDAYDVMKDQYDRADPEQVAQLDADVAVENARWNDVLNSGEGFVDESATVKKPEVGETLEELYAKVRAQNEQFDVAQREIDAANRE